MGRYFKLNIMSYFFTADQHYGHFNIIRYCNRPFKTIDEMDEELIKRHNEVVKNGDNVIHAGDFCWEKIYFPALEKYISRLNGNHTFLDGSHDVWLKSSGRRKQIWEKNIDGQVIVVCHYAMRVWSKSHYGSWQLYGHSHGTLPPEGKQYDIGVDNNNFYPVSFEQIVEIMKTRPDNFNLVRKNNEKEKR